jgi:hypothetical protein
MSINQRLNVFFKSLNLKLTSFSEITGIGQSTFSELIKFENTDKIKYPGYEVLNKLLVAYPNLSAEWLLRGEGEMFRNGNGYDILAIEGLGGVAAEGEGVYVAKGSDLAKCEEQVTLLRGQVEYLEAQLAKTLDLLLLIQNSK